MQHIAADLFVMKHFGTELLIVNIADVCYYINTEREQTQKQKSSEEIKMKNNKGAMKKILSAVPAGAMMMTTAAAVTASADDSYSTDHTETSILPDMSTKSILEYIERDRK